MSTRKVRLKIAEEFDAFHYTGNNLDELRAFVEDLGGIVIEEHITDSGPKLYVEDHLFGYSHEVTSNTFWVYRNPAIESYTRESFLDLYELVENE